MLPIGRTPGSFSDNERVLVSVQFLNWGELQALSQVLTNGHAEHYVDYISFRKTSSNNKNIKQSSIKKKKKTGFWNNRKQNLHHWEKVPSVILIYMQSLWAFFIVYLHENQLGLHQFCWKKEDEVHLEPPASTLERIDRLITSLISKTYASHLRLQNISY